MGRLRKLARNLTDRQTIRHRHMSSFWLNDTVTWVAALRGIGLIGALLFFGCIPKQPTKTTRPEALAAPFEERTVVSTSGHTYRYLYASGPGPKSPTIVLLSGGIFDNRIWLYAGELSRHFNLYALDWPNNSLFYTGKSSDYGDITRDFLSALSLNEVILMGVSMGTFAAIDVAVKQRDPLKVRALVLISTVMFGVSEKETEERMKFSQFGLRLSPDRLRSMLEWRTTGNTYDRAPGDIQQSDIFWIRPYPYYYQIFSMSKNQGAQRQQTENIECPVLLLHGTEDELMDIDVARLNPSRFKNAKWVELQGLKHSMVFSHGPIIVEQTERFLKSKGLLP